MEIALISLIVVMLAVLVLQFLQHKNDRADYKELALNQQNHINSMLEILRWRSGMPTASVKTNEEPSPLKAPQHSTVPKFTENGGNPFLQSDNHQAVAKKPVGRNARIAIQEDEEQNQALGE